MRRILITAMALVVSALVLALIIVNLEPIRAIRRHVKEGEQRRVRLLCETEYEVLLQACRELSNRVMEGDLKPGRYIVRQDPDPEVSGFPQVVVDLEPTYVDVEADGRVVIELFGGIVHCGVMAYPANYKYDPHLHYGDRELIPGLWHYDDGYDEFPDYDKRVDALIEKHRVKRRAGVSP